jgi:hypothetical protein
VTTILHVISGLGMGGAERNLVQVAGGLQARDLSQHVACVGGPGVWADQRPKGASAAIREDYTGQPRSTPSAGAQAEAGIWALRSAH